MSYIFKSIVSYFYVSCGGSITSIEGGTANLSANSYL